MSFKYTDVAALDKHLEERSYIVGFVPSKADEETFAAVGAAPEAKFVNALRWYNQINSYPESERKAWVEGKDDECLAAAASTSGKKEKAPKKEKAAKKEEKKEEDDADFDPFADETADEKATIEAARTKKAEEQAKLAAEKKSGRSQLVIDIKPWDDETPMKKLEAAVRGIDITGLQWGDSKLVPVGYGIKKLTIICTVVDELVSTDDIEEKVCALTDFVQSMDVVAFNKL